AVHGRVVNEPPDRAAREREFDAVTELHRVNLSPENRFEASALAGNSTATGTLASAYDAWRQVGKLRRPPPQGSETGPAGDAIAEFELITNGRRYMSKNDLTMVYAPKLKTTAKKKKTGRTASLNQAVGTRAPLD